MCLLSRRESLPLSGTDRPGRAVSAVGSSALFWIRMEGSSGNNGFDAYMGMSEALAEGAALFYQARLPPDRPPAARTTWRERTGGGVVDRARLESVCT